MVSRPRGRLNEYAVMLAPLRLRTRVTMAANYANPPISSSDFVDELHPSLALMFARHAKKSAPRLPRFALRFR